MLQATVRRRLHAQAGCHPAPPDPRLRQLQQFDAEARGIRDETKKILEQAGASPKSKDSDYVFITFVLNHLPHGVVGLLVAVIFCATMSATAGALNALGSTTAVDFYRPLIRPNESDHHYVVATQFLTAAWGLVAIAVASFASLVENLIEAGNILGSVFYGSILGLFLVAFFLRNVRGSAVFFAAVLAQTLVLVSSSRSNIGYLWYNLIGCAAVLLFALPFFNARFPRSHVMSSPIICFGQQPCGFFPKRFLYAKITRARRLQQEIGGEIVFFFHDSDHDPRETMTVLREQHTGREDALNFQFANKIQKTIFTALRETSCAGLAGENGAAVAELCCSRAGRAFQSG